MVRLDDRLEQALVEERLDWLNETREIRVAQGRFQDAAVMRFTSRVISDLVAMGQYPAAKRQLEKARVPYVPYLELSRDRVVVR